MKGTHTGWTEEEDAALLRAALDARRERQSLKTAFDSIAEQTDRKPNSVRNTRNFQLPLTVGRRGALFFKRTIKAITEAIALRKNTF